MKQQPIIKFNAPPENCERCWKERKKHIKSVLSKMDLYKVMEINVPIVGKISQADLDKLDKFLKGELIKMKKGYIHLTYITV